MMGGDDPNHAARKDTGDALRFAYPMERAMGEYVTRIELADAMKLVEAKLITSELRQRNWVLGGCLAIILAFGGGYVSLVDKLDRLNEAMPLVNNVLEARHSWMLRKDQVDAHQDTALGGLDKKYIAPPYVEPPK